MAACVLARVLRVLRVRVLLRALVLVRVLRVLRVRVRRHVLCCWFCPELLASPGHHQCVYLYVYAGHDPDHRGGDRERAIMNGITLHTVRGVCPRVGASASVQD